MTTENLPAAVILTTTDEGRPLRCPQCNKIDGTTQIGESLWGYCTTHRTKWIAAWDFKAPVNREDQQRRYDELGLGKFKYVGIDAEGYETSLRAADGELPK
jgi:hypothetical protein